MPIGHGSMSVDLQHPAPMLGFQDTRPGKHRKSYWKWPEIVDFPIKNGDFSGNPGYPAIEIVDLPWIYHGFTH